MKNHVTIDPETMAVLERATITETSVKLPEEKLERSLYDKVNKVLTTAGGKWNRSAQAHVFPTDPRERLGMALEKGVILDTKKARQAFYTPADVAAKLVEYGDVEGQSVLEPSAGHGAIVNACLNAGASAVQCVELDTASCEVLRKKGYKVLEGDFLDVVNDGNPRRLYQRIVMNPPFTSGQDIKHVTHAYELLASGGILTAIMAPGWQTKQDKASAAFRDLVRRHGEVVEELPAGTFRESGTNVVTVIVRLHK